MNDKAAPSEWDVYAARALMLSFFLPTTVQGGLFMIAGLYFPIRTYRMKQQISRQDLAKALVISCSYFLYVVAIGFTAPQYRDVVYTIISNRASYVLIPVILALTSSELRKTIASELNYFVYGCFTLCLFVNVAFIRQFNLNAVNQVFTHVDYRKFIEHAGGIHPTYLSIYLCFSIAILLSPLPYAPKMNTPIRYILGLSCLAFLIALLTKSAIIALIVMLILYALQNRKFIVKKLWADGRGCSYHSRCILADTLCETTNFRNICRHG